MDTQPLKNIGLADEEISVYLTLLRKGTTTASKIATETSIDRATTYRFLDVLINKGLASYVIQNNVKYFTAANPKQLVYDLKEKQDKLKVILPNLEALTQLPKEETTVELYKGPAGLRTILKDIIREKKPYTYFGEVNKFFEELDEYAITWLHHVGHHNIRGKVLISENDRMQVAKTETYRLLPADFISKTSTWTYGSKTALFIWSKPLYGVLIDNADVTQANQKLFYALWALGKEPTRKQLLESRV